MERCVDEQPGAYRILRDAQPQPLAILFRLLPGADLAGEASGQRYRRRAYVARQLARGRIVAGDQPP